MTKYAPNALSRASSIALASALFIAATAPAVAQTGSDDVAEENNDDVIIVTAQKFEQKSTDVPITISANSGARLKELGVSDLDELSNYVPGLNIQEQSANNPGIVIRGITSDSGSAQQAARVTLYYNGVDISRSRGSYQDLYDIDRIEVIKGPQATLFGTASAVGAISIISAKPKPGLSGEVSGSYGNFDAYTLGGHLNAGNDTVAVRLAGAYKKRDGYVTNLAPNQDDLYAQDQLGARASFRFTPSSDFTADLILTYDRQRNSGTPFISGTLPTSAGPANPFGPADLRGSPFSAAVLGDADLGLTRDVYDANLTMSWDIADDWTLTMVNGYRKFNSNEVFDADGSAAFFLEFAEDANGEQGSHETRFAYTSDTFRGSFGWNLFREDSNQRVPFSTDEVTYFQCLAGAFNAYLPAGSPPIPCVSSAGIPAGEALETATGGLITTIPYSAEFENFGKNDSYSVFADGTWIPTPSVELTAGVRVLIEKRRSGYRATAPGSVFTGAPPFPLTDTAGQTFRTEDSFSAVLPRFNILYRFSDDINGFATISKGRRSATVNAGARATPTGPVGNFTDIAPEIVWNYEVGLKGAVGPVSGSLGVYYQTYENFQVSVNDPTRPGTTITRSAGSASNFGVEAEVNVRAADWLSLFANIGYIDGGIDDDPANGNLAGARFRLQPEVQAAAGFTLDYPINDSTRLFATPSVTYRSRVFFEAPNSNLISQPAVTLVNVRAGVSFADERFEIAGFARNLTNKNYLLDAGNTGGGFGIPTFIPAEPRFYGVQASAKF
ncbi:MAG: TonB-dependent receptor [Sphingomonadales bacterium]|nr:TonB-dependent receptor [Sphingomonadales bacterium]NCO48276.1 TonB-dependent receptor [Sphingomonadales bacterium]NCP00612.1 TonB-dependent receptor [Sphingomonadales bacterium]NCP25384.1 TonB-dependent receptor [Sphingomonadales bacterium]NCP41820.1 TonB-dependent receptor [Sphingomonadales bacterium]